MKLLLDTQIFLWFVTNNSQLAADIFDLIEDDANEVFVSVVTIWEAVIKYAIGKLALPEPPAEYLPIVRAANDFDSLLLDEDTMPHLATLPLLHRDPFDRVLVAQALQHGLTVVSVDGEVRKYPVPVYPPRPV